MKLTSLLWLTTCLFGCGGGGGTAAVVVASVELYGESTLVQKPVSVGDYLQQSIAMVVINRAVPSTTARQQYEGRDGLNLPWRQQLASSKASVIVINRGINDAFQEVNPVDFRSVMASLITEALAAGKRVILQTPNQVMQPYAAGVLVNAQIIRDLGQLYKVPVSDTDLLPGGTIDTLHPDPILELAMAQDLARLIRGL